MAILTPEALQVLNTKTFPSGVKYKDAILRKEPLGEKDNPDFDDQIPEHPDTNPRQIPMTLVEHANDLVKNYLERIANMGHASIDADDRQRAKFE